MKIEITLKEREELTQTDNQLRGWDSFAQLSPRAKKCRDTASIYGEVSIDGGKPVDFYYSPYFEDGDIFTDDKAIKWTIQQVIPAYWVATVKATKS